MKVADANMQSSKLSSDHAQSQFVSDIPVILIEPSRGRMSLKHRELWEYRELLYFLTWWDIKVRYKQTLVF